MAVTAVASSTTSAQALAAGDREAVLMENSDANRVYILYGSGTASATNYSISLASNENASIPTEFVRGEFTAVWAADGSGSLHITTA